MKLSHLVSLAAVLSVVGCAAKEELLAKNANVPTGVNLSGQWQLRSDSEVPARRIDDALVHVFLETGRALKVTQTDNGLFVSFDRAIVEEYRFGEKRQIHVGPIEAQRVSGWEGLSYVIETLDSDGAKLIETYRLQEDSQSLFRTMKIIYKGAEQLNIKLHFARL